MQLNKSLPLCTYEKPNIPLQVSHTGPTTLTITNEKPQVDAPWTYSLVLQVNSTNHKLKLFQVRPRHTWFLHRRTHIFLLENIMDNFDLIGNTMYEHVRQNTPFLWLWNSCFSTHNFLSNAERSRTPFSEMRATEHRIHKIMQIQQLTTFTHRKFRAEYRSTYTDIRH
jgi:hypothetical protein